MALLLIILVCTLVVSFLCSFLESIILSVTHTHIAVLIKDEKKSGYYLRDMKKNINHPLAAILTLNTIANTAGAASVAAQAYQLFGREWVALTSGILTVLILIFSEIIPKTLGAVFWKKLSNPAAYMLKGLIMLTLPVVFFFEKISQFIARHGSHYRITREELIVLAELGAREGILEKQEALILENLLLLKEMKTGDVLTPRSVILAVEKNQTVGEVVKTYAPIHFSRIPVYDQNIDAIIGVVLTGEVLEAFYTGKTDEPVERFMKPLHAVPDSKSIADLLNDFITRREHIFLVVDEYGGTAGIVTLEDAVETLLGVEIVDEFDSVADMREYALELWKKRRRERETL